ncbi:MAG: MFS transporter [Burkholderiaceae bacterium]
MKQPDPEFRLGSIAVPAFGPSLFDGIAQGAILPVIAFSARELGASFAGAGLIVALIGVGSLLGNLPAAMISSRFGERRAMMGAATACVAALLVCILATGPWMLGLGVLLFGMTHAVFALARQTFLIEAVPYHYRARALSTLAGVTRIGMFIGPFAGAAAMYGFGLRSAYVVAILSMMAIGWMAYSLPDLPGSGASPASATERPSMAGLLRSHAAVFGTLGFGVLLISAVRASRQVIIPLWATHLGLPPVTASIIYGLSAAIDMTAFYPAGKVMDARGRVWVALPACVLMGLALLAMTLTTGTASFIATALALGLGNGIGSGIVMTIGADSAPPQARPAFLGLWRMLADVGACSGPLLLSALTAAVSLGAGIAATGLLALGAAGVFWRWLPRRG